MGLDIAAERKEAARTAERIAEKKENDEALKQKKEEYKTYIKAELNDVKQKILLPKWVCTQCGTTGKPKSSARGSMATELILWLIGASLFVFLPALIFIPIFYSLWRFFFRDKGCPACKGKMISTKTPIGKQLLSRSTLNNV